MMRQMILASALLMACAALPPDVSAQAVMQLKPPPDTAPMVGQPQIVSSSSIALNGKRVLFFGVDPVMMQQPCYIGNRGWDCGTAARRILMNLIGREAVTCEPKGIDIFSRVFSKCAVNGQDIALALIEAGMAVAVPEETTDYVEPEKKAKAAKKGIWQGTFVTPSEFREIATGHPQGR